MKENKDDAKILLAQGICSLIITLTVWVVFTLGNVTLHFGQFVLIIGNVIGALGMMTILFSVVYYVVNKDLVFLFFGICNGFALAMIPVIMNRFNDGVEVGSISVSNIFYIAVPLVIVADTVYENKKKNN